MHESAQEPEGTTSYSRISLISFLFITLFIVQIRLVPGNLVIGGFTLDDAAHTGLIAQLMALSSLWLVIKDGKPGFAAAVALNAGALLGALSLLLSGRILPAALPLIVSSAGILALVMMTRAYQDSVSARAEEAGRFVVPEGRAVQGMQGASRFAAAGKTTDEPRRSPGAIMARAQAGEALTRGADLVPLTGLYNRTSLERALEGSLRQASPRGSALISVNLVGLDKLSLRYGYRCNQSVIRQIAQALKAFASDEAALYHTGENRFAFFIKQYEDSARLEELGGDISAALRGLLKAYGTAFGIGIMEVGPGCGDTADDMLRNLLITSEAALTIAGGQRNICLWGEEIGQKAAREHAVTNALTEIITGIGEERLFMQYQPIWAAKPNRVYAHEALVRLEMDGYGLIPPAEFIPIAEKNNLIVPLGEKIIGRIFLFMDRMNQSRPEGLALSINISVLQLLSAGFEDEFISRVRAARLDPGQIFVELTESVLSEEYEVIRKAITKLKAAGMKMMLDDFGTGGSSFERFCELEIDCVKIDKLFIDQLLEMPPEDSIVGDVIAMVHKMGQCVVAEGVEHRRQLDSLLRFGCDNIQGYLISRPLDEEEALRFDYRDEIEPAPLELSPAACLT